MRSAAALKRRAEKRNISEFEMRKIDSQSSGNKRTRSSHSPGEKPSKRTLLSTEKWTCRVCTNVNLARMCPRKCNNCQRLRVEVDTATGSTRGMSDPAFTSSHWICRKCNNKNLTEKFPITCNRCQRKRDGEANNNVADLTKFDDVDNKKPTATKSFEDTSQVRRKRQKSTSGKDEQEVTCLDSVASSEKSSSQVWICRVCKNENLSDVHEFTCNRCQRHRKLVEDKIVSAVKKDVENAYWSCKVCKNRNISAVHIFTCNRCQRNRKLVDENALPGTNYVCEISNSVKSVSKPAKIKSVGLQSQQITQKSSNRTSVISSDKVSHEVWVCTKCKNKNLKSLSLSACNRCQRPRKDVDASNCDTDSPERKKTNCWNNAAADKELIERNMKLRSDYLNPEINKVMSAEDKDRALILIERSKRKQEKKEKKKKGLKKKT